MNKLFLVSLLFIIGGFFNYSSSQTTTGMTAKDFFAGEDYNRALDAYLILYRDKKDDLEINLNIGLCYLKVNNDRSKAIPYLEYVYNKDKSSIELLLNLGRAYMYHYEFDKAIQFYTDFRNKTSSKNYETVDHLIENCENAKVLIKNPVNVTFENLGKIINSKFADYYPFVTDNESTLYFTSRREGNTQKIKTWQGYFTADIYYSKVNSGEWTKPRNAGSLINTSEDEECVYLSPDQKKMIVYQDDQNEALSGDLFMATSVKNKAFPKPIPFTEPVNTIDPELEGCITQEGDMMIIASDREGSHGKADLFMFKKLPNGAWGKSINLGPNVNTEYNEAFPVFDEKNNILYFSSEGHTNMGGFDIFKAKFNAKTQQFEKALNMGYPINTPEDNMVFTLAENKRDGYISAVRKEGLGDLDIYKITLNDIENRPSIIKGILSTNENQKKDINAFVFIMDSKTNKALDSIKVNPKIGKYIFAVEPGKKYIITVKSAEFQSIKQEIIIYDKSDYLFEIQQNIVLKKNVGNAPKKYNQKKEKS